MREIVVTPNTLDLKVYVNGEPQLSELYNDELTLMAAVLELIVSKQFENYTKRKSRANKKRSPQNDTPKNS